MFHLVKEKWTQFLIGLRSCCKFTPAGRATFLVFCVFYVIMHSCSGQISLYGEHPLIHTLAAAAAAPTDVDVFQDTFCCHTYAQPAPYIFFSSHALGLDPQYATLRHYPSPLVIPFMDGSDSLVCYLILTSHVHFFFMQSHMGKPRLDPSPLAN